MLIGPLLIARDVNCFGPLMPMPWAICAAVRPQSLPAISGVTKPAAHAVKAARTESDRVDESELSLVADGDRGQEIASAASNLLGAGNGRRDAFARVGGLASRI